MHIVDTLLLVIARENNGELRGRTLLQKKIYFLSVLLKENYGFSAHYYGPYSSFVAEHLDGLVNYGVLNEVTESFTSASSEENFLGEIRRHTYSFTHDAEKIWDITQQKPDFQKWDDALRSINDKEISHDFNKLSIAAKVHYIVSWEGKSALKQIQKIAKDYGWNVRQEDIISVYSFLSELGLVTTDKT